jgi:hypothetical protein
MPKMQITVLEQTTSKGHEKMSKQQEQKITWDKDGLRPTHQPFLATPLPQKGS